MPLWGCFYSPQSQAFHCLAPVISVGRSPGFSSLICVGGVVPFGSVVQSFSTVESGEPARMLAEQSICCTPTFGVIYFFLFIVLIFISSLFRLFCKVYLVWIFSCLITTLLDDYLLASHDIDAWLNTEQRIYLLSIHIVNLQALVVQTIGMDVVDACRLVAVEPEAECLGGVSI